MKRLIAMLVLALPAAAMAQDDQPSLDELLDLTPPPAEERPQETPAPAEGAIDLDEALRRQLEGEGPQGRLEQAIDQMEQVTARLGRDRDPGPATQRIIESILDKLDAVIDEAQRRQQGQQSQQQGQASNRDSQAQQVAQQGGQPAGGQQRAGATTNPQDSGPTRGTPIQQQLDHRPMEALRREWGSLPPRLRDELREGLDERFSPIYQRLTEAYYRRLAEEE